MSQRSIVFICVAVSFVLALAGWRETPAQVVPRANWIWFDEGDPLKEAPAEPRYFRRSFEEGHELAEAEMHIACDNEFTLFVNGQEVARGSEWKDGKVIDVKKFLVRGKNAIAIRAANAGGPAGLIAWLVRRTVPGNHYTLLSDASWKCSKEAPESWREINFDDSAWPAAKVLGELGKIEQWAGVTWNGKPDPARFRVPAGFTIDLAADPELTGSIVNMTFDTKGRPVISRERGPVFILEDEDGDGKFDTAKEYTGEVTNCQGMLAYDARTFYLVGEQRKKDEPVVTGLFRLTDEDGDDVADQVELLHQFRGGMGEHGPHAIIVGPDGYLYLAVGNHAWVQATPEPGSPVTPFQAFGQWHNEAKTDHAVQSGGLEVPLRTLLKGYEADLLKPRYEDANGHAAGIRVPGGSIWRIDPDAKQFTLETCGFRNQYDIAFNSLGEVFSFDSDMEWDEQLPWYRPVRVNHCPPGADFGWRSGSHKWPPYYVDSLPATVDTGRGSPCGVVFYNHTAFPAKYHDAFFITDWSYGRIFAVHLKRDGATFTGEAEEFVTGKPLNVTDIEVAPDGSMFFTTGGRNTEGGVYRIRPSETNANAPINDKSPVQYALDQPQPQSAWGREAIRRLKEQTGEQWASELASTAASAKIPTARRVRALEYLMQFGPEPSLQLARRLARDDDLEVRAQAAVLLARHPAVEIADDLVALLQDAEPLVQRRALEGLIRTQTPAPLDKLRPLLAHRDRFLRFAARLALERLDHLQWCHAIAADKDPRVKVMGMIAINRIGLVAIHPDVAATVFEHIHGLLQAKLPPEDELDVLRALELTLVNAKTELRPDSVQAIGKLLLDRFPTGDQPLDRELSRIIAALRVPGGVDELLAALERIGGTESMAQRADAIHYARCVVATTQGGEDGAGDWTPELRRRYFAWFDLSRDWKAGHSYAGYITNFLRDAVARTSEPERLAIVRDAARFQRAATRIVHDWVNDKSDPAFIAALSAILESGDSPPVPRGDVLAALGRTGRAEAEAVLLRAYEQNSGERDPVVRALANFQNTRNWPIFVRALDSEDKETVRAAVRALVGIDQRPDGPAAYRAAIQAAGRVGDQGGWDTVLLLRQWAGKHFGHKKQDWKQELEQWQGWYAETYPDAPAATLAESKPMHDWTYDQLLAFLEGDGRKGSVEAGRTLYEKAVCAKCHKLEQTGTGLGPDLSTLASRFKRKDILEAIIYPSRVISDQYKSVLVATTDGRVITAMRAPDDGENLVLLLSDATTLKLAKSDVDEMVDGKQSVMPDGLLNQLSLTEIADLFAFLESGKATAPAGNGQNQ